MDLYNLWAVILITGLIIALGQIAIFSWREVKEKRTKEKIIDINLLAITYSCILVMLMLLIYEVILIGGW